MNRLAVFTFSLLAVILLSCGDADKQQPAPQYLVGINAPADMPGQKNAVYNCGGAVVRDIKATVILVTLPGDSLTCYKENGTYEYIEINQKVTKAD